MDAFIACQIFIKINNGPKLHKNYSFYAREKSESPNPAVARIKPKSDIKDVFGSSHSCKVCSLVVVGVHDIEKFANMWLEEIFKTLKNCCGNVRCLKVQWFETCRRQLK